MIKDLQWIREKTSHILNFNINQTDQDFIGTTTNRWLEIDEAINEAYEVEANEAMINGGTDWFIETQTASWLTSVFTYTLPDYLQNSEILRIDDETHSVPGYLLWVCGRGQVTEPNISWRDKKTLQWGTTGPGENKTLRFTYLPAPELLVDPTDEPRLIMSRFRVILPWQAAIILRREADQAAPSEWVNHLMEWRERFYIFLSKGRPRESNRTTIQMEEIE